MVVNLSITTSLTGDYKQLLSIYLSGANLVTYFNFWCGLSVRGVLGKEVGVINIDKIKEGAPITVIVIIVAVLLVVGVKGVVESLFSHFGLWRFLFLINNLI